MTIFRCQSCRRELPSDGMKYVVEVRSFADFDGYLEQYPGDIDDGLEELLDAMENIDPCTMEDEVYMEHTYIVCKSCRDRFARDPFHTETFADAVELAKGTLH
ncbi:hypothetical protein MNBD_DELTA02-919 [hydrothermal vent metagenome]|uniref:Uncharacterized protein n=1 Tax=hydrothermal vent metagenome TaxID=652676 RepID=A0A3B0VRK4_9ZZZZ